MSKLEVFTYMLQQGKEQYTVRELIQALDAKALTTRNGVTRLMNDFVIEEVKRGTKGQSRIIKLTTCHDCDNPDINMVRMIKLNKLICQKCFIKLRARHKRRVKLNPKEAIY